MSVTRSLEVDYLLRSEALGYSDVQQVCRQRRVLIMT